MKGDKVTGGPSANIIFSQPSMIFRDTAKVIILTVAMTSPFRALLKGKTVEIAITSFVRFKVLIASVFRTTRPLALATRLHLPVAVDEGVTFFPAIALASRSAASFLCKSSFSSWIAVTVLIPELFKSLI